MLVIHFFGSKYSTVQISFSFFHIILNHGIFVQDMDGNLQFFVFSYYLELWHGFVFVQDMDI